METSEVLFECVLRTKSVIEYGSDLRSIATRKVAPPTEGARFDLTLEGSIDGPKFQGIVYGVDHINIRADGEIELHTHAQFDLHDGGRVSYFADGSGKFDASGGLSTRENVALKSNSPTHTWVNSTHVRAIGSANLVTGEFRAKGYRR
jgi:hypothetical protein